MEKGRGKKGLFIGIAIVIVAAVIATVVILLNREEVFRLIKIYEFDGTATVTRQELGELEPYSNMVLESGDDIYLDTGKMTLQLDNDKYVYVEEKTEFALEAKGDSADSQTTINLKSGAIVNELQNKLSEKSSYEVNTPNSTMAVRGTIYRTEVYYDEEQVCYTKVSVFQGKVDTRLVSIEAGKETVIYQNEDETDYLDGVRDIDYSAFSEETLKLLKNLTDEGKDMSVTSKEIDEYLNGPFTVTFLYQGAVFGTQTVEKGQCAKEPKLMPAASGGWDYDFSSPVTGDLEINWK